MILLGIRPNPFSPQILLRAFTILCFVVYIFVVWRNFRFHVAQLYQEKFLVCKPLLTITLKFTLILSKDT